MSCEGELILLCKIQCCVVFWLELYINLGLGLSWTEQPTSGNMWKVTEMFCVFVASATFTLRWGLLSMLSRAVLYSWLMISTLVGLLERTGFWHWSLSPLKLNQWWCWYHITYVPLVVAGGANSTVQTRETYDPTYCSVKLPGPQPLAPMDAETAERYDVLSLSSFLSLSSTLPLFLLLSSHILYTSICPLAT